MSGVLEEAGYIPFEGEADPDAGVLPDLVVFNTCAVRENADNRLYGTLGHLRPWKDANPRLQIAVGGCLAQKDKDVVVSRAPWVDVVFGTHNLGHLATLLERSRHNQRRGRDRGLPQHFPSTLPAPGTRRTRAGCRCPWGQQHPHVLHRPRCAQESTAGPARCSPSQHSRTRRLEVTLLGQNVNAYGRSFHDPDGPPTRRVRQTAQGRRRIEGIERVRFTSPHPAEFTDDVIGHGHHAHGVPQPHMPLQSGSDRVLRAIAAPTGRRSSSASSTGTRRDARGRHHDRHHRGVPRRDRGGLQATLDLVEKARFSSVHLPVLARPGTPAATMENQIPRRWYRTLRLIALRSDHPGGNRHWSDGRWRCSSPRTRPEGRRHRTDDGRVAATDVSCTSHRTANTRRESAPATSSPRPSPPPHHHLLADGGCWVTAPRGGRPPRGGGSQTHRSAWDSPAPVRRDTPTADVTEKGCPT